MKPTKGIAVDGGCLGNPGISEYRIVDIETGKLLCEINIGMGTNNIAEFIGLCHAIHYVNKNNITLDIYSDSLIAISWVKKKKHNSSYQGINAIKRLEKACEYLQDANINNIKKWHTRKWGEIPADFGRK